MEEACFPAAAQFFQRGQPLQAVIEMRTQAAEGIPLAFGQGFTGLANQVHEDGDERGGQEQDQTGKRVAWKNDEQNT